MSTRAHRETVIAATACMTRLQAHGALVREAQHRSSTAALTGADALARALAAAVQRRGCTASTHVSHHRHVRDARAVTADFSRVMMFAASQRAFFNAVFAISLFIFDGRLSYGERPGGASPARVLPGPGFATKE
jgi:hypothetical protein